MKTSPREVDHGAVDGDANAVDGNVNADMARRQSAHGPDGLQYASQ